MIKRLRALFVEDSEDDVALIVRHLNRGGYEPEWTRVQTAETMRAALEQPREIIFSDYQMPGFDAPRALEVLKTSGLDIPFIIVSGTVGEDIAVACMRAGAHDYLPKGNLTRLIVALERELREAANREEQRKMEGKLLISERMAAVGTLAAGVAHEMNNPLAYVSANLEFALKGLDDFSQSSSSHVVDEVNEALVEARQGIDRLRNVVKDLKAFSRADDKNREPVQLRRILESSLNMAWNEIRHRARLVKDLADVPPVDGNESRLGQVFLNLLLNAAQAIPDGEADRNEIRIITRKDGGERVVVEIRDTGSGISPEIRSRLFQPFVTTKPSGVGTGLGLSICHAIISAHGGVIDVESDLGKGTTFRITLPVAKREPVAKPPLESYSGPSRRGRILLIDDEPMIGSAFRRTLSAEHDVVSVTRAKEALTRLTSGEQFDLVFCDVMMPEMTGIELHSELTQVAPNIASRMIFLSGGAFTQRARDFLDQVPNQRMEKPFDVSNLRAVIRAMLR